MLPRHNLRVIALPMDDHSYILAPLTDDQIPDWIADAALPSTSSLIPVIGYTVHVIGSGDHAPPIGYVFRRGLAYHSEWIDEDGDTRYALQHRNGLTAAVAAIRRERLDEEYLINRRAIAARRIRRIREVLAKAEETLQQEQDVTAVGFAQRQARSEAVWSARLWRNDMAALLAAHTVNGGPDDSWADTRTPIWIWFEETTDGSRVAFQFDPAAPRDRNPISFDTAMDWVADRKAEELTHQPDMDDYLDDLYAETA